MQRNIYVDFRGLDELRHRLLWAKTRGAPAVARGVLTRLAKAARFDYIPETWGESVTVRKKTFLKSHLKYTAAAGNSIAPMRSMAGVMDNKKTSKNIASIDSGGASNNQLWMQLDARIGKDNTKRVAKRYKDILRKMSDGESSAWQLLYRDNARTLLLSANGALIEILGVRGGKRRKRGSVTKDAGERRAYNKKYYPLTPLTSARRLKFNKQTEFVNRAGHRAVEKRLNSAFRLEMDAFLKKYEKK
jgi:hypothetical protein